MRMSFFDEDSKFRQIASVAFAVGTLLTEPKPRGVAFSDVSGRIDGPKDSIAGGYRSVADRLDSVGAALRGRGKFASHALAVTAGIGMGVGLGLLLAPVRGKETRDALTNKASDLKSKVVEATKNAAAELPSQLPAQTRAS
jgi:hypothetical protein